MFLMRAEIKYTCQLLLIYESGLEVMDEITIFYHWKQLSKIFFHSVEIKLLHMFLTTENSFGDV